MKISFVIPCYRSEKTLDGVIQEIIQVLPTIKDANDYEIIMVNDCSPDNVWQVISRLCSDNSHCKGLELEEISVSTLHFLPGTGMSPEIMSSVLTMTVRRQLNPHWPWLLHCKIMPMSCVELILQKSTTCSEI